MGQDQAAVDELRLVARVPKPPGLEHARSIHSPSIQTSSTPAVVQHVARDLDQRRVLGGADLGTRTLVLQRLQHQGGNRAVQRLLAPPRQPTVQRCGPIPHDVCPCNDDGPAEESATAPPAPLQRQALDDLLAPAGLPKDGAQPEVDSAQPTPAGPSVPAGAVNDSCPPGYTICDFINLNISVQGQYALNRLYQRGGDACHDAIQILSAVRSGQVQGVFKADEGKPAMLAQRNGTGWWTLHDHPSSVPQGGQAFVFEGEEPPMVVFKKSAAEDREALATALHGAWNASTIGGSELEVSPPTLRSCEPAAKEPPPKECPPGTKPDPADPENCIPQESECPPGTIQDPNNPDSCLLPKPGQIIRPCSDAEVFSAFQSAQDQCAHIKMGIDMICQLGPDVCDLAGPFSKNPIAKNICKIVDPDQVKEKECKKPRAQYYADCTVSSVIGMKPTMKCDPGTGLEIFEKYKRWPGRIT